MSNPQADRQDSTADVIVERISASGGGDPPPPNNEGNETRTSIQDSNAQLRQHNARPDRTSRAPVNRPMRTSSAPLEEHGEVLKANFQPTKTHTWVPTQDARRTPHINQASGYRPHQGRGRDEMGHGSGVGTETNSTNESSLAAQPGSDTPQTTSTAPSPPTTGGDGMTIATNIGSESVDRVPPHSPGGIGASGDTSSQGSPVFPPGATRTYRSGSGNSSPSVGPSGYNRDSPHGRGDYRDNRDSNRDPRLNGGRLGGRRPPQQSMPAPAGYGQRPPHMGMPPMHDPMAQQRDMGRGMAYPGGGAPPAMPPQQWQPQPGVQFVDQYGHPVPPPVAQQYGYAGAPPPSVPQGMARPQQGPPQGQMMPQPHQQAPPNMYGQVPPPHQQQAQPQQMMPVYPGQQYVIPQQMGQRFVQTPQGYVQQTVYPAGPYGMEYTAEQINTDVMNQAIMGMQAIGVIPGTHVNINMGQGTYSMQMPGMSPGGGQYIHYPQQGMHPQHMQMQQQPMPQQAHGQMPMYVAGPPEMGYAAHPQQHMMQAMPGAQGMPAMGVPMAHMQQPMGPAGQQYAGYPPQPMHQQGHHAPPGHYNQPGPPRHQNYPPGGRPPQQPQAHHPHGAVPPDSSTPPHSHRGPPPHRQTPQGQAGDGMPGTAASPSTPQTPSTTAASPQLPPQQPSAKPRETPTGSKSSGSTVPEVAPLPPAAGAAATSTSTAPTQDQAPIVVKERKALKITNKDGTTVDMQKLAKKGPSESAPPTPPVPTPASASPAIEEQDAVPKVADMSDEAAKVEPVVGVAAAETEPAPAPAASEEVPAVEAAAPAVTAAPSVEQTAAPPVVPKKIDAPIATVPTVLEQLQGLRVATDSISTAATESNKEDTSPLSPAIKFADLPVSLSSQPVSGYSTVSAVAPPIDVPSAPASSPAVQEVKTASLSTPTAQSKKMSKKEMLAMADARGPTSELSAYTDSAAPVKAAPSAQTSTPSTPVVVAKAQATPQAAQDLPDSWDDAAELTLPPAMVAPAESSTAKESSHQRSLRPGGKAGFSINLHQAAAVIRFTKQEIMALRPTEKFPNPLSVYGSITSNEPGSAPGSAQKGGGQWSKGQRGDARQDNDGWKRDTVMPSPAQSGSGKHRKSNSSAGPMPKKLVSDPMVLLSTETMAILNKITPQTFDKLAQSMLALNVQNIAQMNKVIELIFEKAVQEQSFANLYAALCSFLNANATHWAFYTVFRVVNNEPSTEYEYFWVKECNFPSVYAGPYYSMADLMNAMFAPTLPPMATVPFTPETVECLLLNSIDLLVRVSKHDKTNAYYVTYMPFSDFGEEMRSQNTFADARSALKDAKSKNFFRAKLVTNCQTEFQLSTRNESIYSDLEKEMEALAANKATMSESDYFYRAAEVEEKRIKLKRRMLGNIRFVGELFKQKLLTEMTILACISDLMGSPTSPDGWKDMHDEQDIECLCHLLTTAGERLEQKIAQNYESQRSFNQYFDRLRALTRDKSLNSRMRFAIEEVISLRDNNWQKRRAQDGPVKLSEIHRKMQAEHSGQHLPPAGRAGPGPGPGGPPPQRQQPTQPPRILPRGGASGGPSAGVPGRSGPQDVRRAGAAPGAEMSRTVSSSAYEQGGYRGQYDQGAVNMRPQGGDPIRRTQSEFSSGAATPTSVGSASAVYAATEPPRHTRNLSERSVAEEIDFTDKTLQNRARSVVSEFLEQQDVQEVTLFLRDGPRGTCGHFVLQVIDKCLNAKKGPVVPALIALVGDSAVSEEMQADRDEVLQALRYSEEFKCLVDTTMDFKEAPERFGSVMAALVKAGVITAQEVRDIAQEAHTNCLEELMSDEAESKAIFERFTRQLTADTTDSNES